MSWEKVSSAAMLLAKLRESRFEKAEMLWMEWIQGNEASVGEAASIIL